MDELKRLPGWRDVGNHPIGCGEAMAYKCGHRDSRHAAAKVALDGDAEIVALLKALQALSALQASHGSEAGPALSDWLGQSPNSDVLADLKRAAVAKWRGNPAAQQWGLFARAAAEIERAWAARDAAVADLEAHAEAAVRRAVAIERDLLAEMCWERRGHFASDAAARAFAELVRDMSLDGEI